MVLDCVLRDIAPGAFSLALPHRHFPASSGSISSRICLAHTSTSLAYASRSTGMADVPQIIAHFIAHKKHRNYKYLK